MVLLCDPLNVPIVTQSTPYNCGPAALTSVLRFYGVECFESDIARELNTLPDGTLPRDMARVSRSHGFRVTARNSMKVGALRRALQRHAPAVCLIQAHGGGHYVVVVSCNETTVYLDPWDGKTVRLRTRDFLSLWWDEGGFRRFGLILRPEGTRIP